MYIDLNGMASNDNGVRGPWQRGSVFLINRIFKSHKGLAGSFDAYRSVIANRMPMGLKVARFPRHPLPSVHFLSSVAPTPAPVIDPRHRGFVFETVLSLLLISWFEHR